MWKILSGFGSILIGSASDISLIVSLNFSVVSVAKSLAVLLISWTSWGVFWIDSSRYPCSNRINPKTKMPMIAIIITGFI